jgi:RNA polymerase sigma-70 factor (ECF subfamily)
VVKREWINRNYPYPKLEKGVLMGRNMGIPQEELLDRAKRLDMQALAEIYDLYNSGLYSYAVRLLGDVELAEDCVAETFSRFLQALHAGNGPQTYLQAYLYRIAHNWITDQYRRQPIPPLSLNEDLHHSSESLPEVEVVENIQKERVRAALLHLTPDQRQVIVLKYYEGWDNAEVAAALNKPIGAVKSLQHRALGGLRRMLLPVEEKNYERVQRAVRPGY